MKRILASSLVVISLIATVGQATFAVFSDSAEIQGNTISTATVNIDLNLLNSEEFSDFDKPINTSNLLPGQWSDWARVEAVNNSDVNVRLYFYVKNVVGDACEMTNLLLKTGPIGGNEVQYQIYNSKILDINGNSERVELTGVYGYWNPTLPAEESLVLWQRAQLDVSADNDYADESCIWDEVFIAESAPADNSGDPVSFPEVLSET
jgi:predicted ribosomally synthesized peptide with SipW-like signal peptide